MKTLPVEQLTSFLREAKETGVYEMYYIELATGLRRGELLGLKWNDIDMSNGTIRVQRQVARIDGEIVEAPLKTKNSYRTVSIGADAIEVLKEQRKKVGREIEYVFPSPNGGPISPDSVLNMLHRVGGGYSRLFVDLFLRHVDIAGDLLTVQLIQEMVDIDKAGCSQKQQKDQKNQKNTSDHLAGRAFLLQSRYISPQYSRTTALTMPIISAFRPSMGA
jgi:hypothetical protein